MPGVWHKLPIGGAYMNNLFQIGIYLQLVSHQKKFNILSDLCIENTTGFVHVKYKLLMAAGLQSPCNSKSAHKEHTLNVIKINVIFVCMQN